MKDYFSLIIGILVIIIATTFLLATAHYQGVPVGVNNQIYPTTPIGDPTAINQYTCTSYTTGNIITAKCTRIK